MKATTSCCALMLSTLAALSGPGCNCSDGGFTSLADSGTPDRGSDAGAFVNACGGVRPLVGRPPGTDCGVYIGGCFRPCTWECVSENQTQQAQGELDCDADGGVPDCSHLDTPCALGRYVSALNGCDTMPRNEGALCDDQNACTHSDACTGGVCTGSVRDCGAELPVDMCEVAVCDPLLGCRVSPFPDEPPVQCDDGVVCTVNDHCVAGVCTGTPRNPTQPPDQCTQRICDPATSEFLIVPTPGAPCNDRNACTTDEVCGENGMCAGDVAAACDDGNDCTADTCDASRGCQHTVLENGTACDDGLFCTGHERCQGGVCRGEAFANTPPEVCNSQACDNLVEQCTYGHCDEDRDVWVRIPLEDNLPCRDDAYCTVDDRCLAGVCTAGSARDCAAAGWEFPCGQASCNEERQTCETLPKSAEISCDDNDRCTVNDHCSGMTNDCVGGSVDHAQCEDGNACTLDQCFDNECVHTPVPRGESCEDGRFCTVNDVCEDGVCAAGEPYELPEFPFTLGYNQGPHVGYEDVLCDTRFTHVVIEYHDRSPRSTAQRPCPRFAKYATMVRHAGLDGENGATNCYPNLTSAHRVGVDPNDRARWVWNLADPFVYNQILGSRNGNDGYFRCLLQHDLSRVCTGPVCDEQLGVDIYMDTALGSFIDRPGIPPLSHLSPQVVQMARDLMDRYPRRTFIYNDCIPDTYVDADGMEKNRCVEILEACGERSEVTCVFTFEGFAYDFAGEPWCTPADWPGCRDYGMPHREHLALVQQLADDHPNVHLWTQEHPQPARSDPACIARDEMACAAAQQGMGMMPWTYSHLLQEGDLEGDGTDNHSFDRYPVDRSVCDP